MAGLLLLVAGATYIGVAVYISFVRIKRWSWRWVAILVFALAPTADAVYGRIELERLCKTEGGLRVNRIIQNVDGFYSPFASERFITVHGFAFVESGTSPKSLVRYEKAPSGVRREHIEAPKSRYQYRQQLGDARDLYMKDRFEIFDREKSEVLATITNFSFAGGWVERFVAKAVAGRANAGTCNLGNSIQLHEQLVLSALRVSK